MFGTRSALILVAGVLTATCAGAPAAAPSQQAPTVRYTPMPTTQTTVAPAAQASATPLPNFSELPVPAMEPTALARQLTMVELAIRDPQVTGDQLQWYGHLQQLIFGRLADFPEWKDAVIAAQPAHVQAPLRNGLEAGRQLRSMGGSPAKTLPDWRILAPPPPDELLRYYREAEAAFGIHWYFLASINLVESRMGRIRGDSSAGAQGPMQFMPATWAAYGQGDVNSYRDAIMGAARYLRASGAPGDMPRALFAYNRSIPYVNAITLYADAMRIDDNVFRGYWGWQVYYWMVDGPLLLPEGWKRP